MNVFLDDIQLFVAQYDQKLFWTHSGVQIQLVYDNTMTQK